MDDSNALAEFFDACSRIGKRVPMWTQGPGSNVSVKSGHQLWIKASGFRLDQVSKSRGVAQLDLNAATAKMDSLVGLEPTERLEAEYADFLKESSVNEFRPSMETGFHVGIRSRLVCHFHSLLSVVMAHHAQVDRTKFQQWMSARGLSFVLVPAMMPGLILSQYLAAYPTEKIFLLQNHGVILGMETSDGLEGWMKCEQEFSRDWGYSKEIPLPEWGPYREVLIDMAVFRERIARIITGGEKAGQWCLRKKHTDKDAEELWLASQWLIYHCPELVELPEALSVQVGDLPTEKFRKSLGERTWNQNTQSN